MANEAVGCARLSAQIRRRAGSRSSAIEALAVHRPFFTTRVSLNVAGVVRDGRQGD